MLLKRICVFGGLLTFASYQITSHYFPEMSQNRLLMIKAAKKLGRLGFSCTKMALIYKFSKRSMEEKHKRAAKILHTALKRN